MLETDVKLFEEVGEGTPDPLILLMRQLEHPQKDILHAVKELGASIAVRRRVLEPILEEGENLLFEDGQFFGEGEVVIRQQLTVGNV